MDFIFIIQLIFLNDGSYWLVWNIKIKNECVLPKYSLNKVKIVGKCQTTKENRWRNNSNS